MKWHYFNYYGEKLDLSHLKSFQWTFQLPKTHKAQALDIKMNVQFSYHCFSRNAPSSEIDKIDSSLFLNEPSEPNRYFCIERYNLSKQLTNIISTLDKRICWHTTGHNSFLTIEIQDENGIPQNYHIYFDVIKKNKGPMTLIIRSAYIKDNQDKEPQPKKRKIRFSVIARNRLMNRKIRPA